MSSMSRKDAQRIIADIGEDNGWISPEDREKTPERVLRSLANVRRKLGAATKTLATNLYSKDTRFVYELIQNADDNEYSYALAAGEQPYLSFQLLEDKIIIDSNEDGFTEQNVKAICSTGESTKSSSQGYIGEKGIGFKSVFKVAKKVHIQSGPFSFSFEHTRDSDQDGLGMVTPFNEPFLELPSQVRTRMTLTLLATSSFDRRADDFRNIPDTLLLFLTKLESIHIEIATGDNSSVIRLLYPRKAMRGQEQQILSKICNKDHEPVAETKNRYYVVRKVLNDLPYDEARRYTRTATVVLAFPVEEENVPVRKSQHVFAFLPLRDVGFKFLIQSDFITQASREDVFQSAWNEALLEGIAASFIDAVTQFLRHKTLRYQWMRYLPKDEVSDEFWKQLKAQILSRLQHVSILESRYGGLYKPDQLRDWKSFCYTDGSPLVDDLIPPLYLSSRYDREDIVTLKTLGLRPLYYKEFLARVGADLNQGNSKMKANYTSIQWHTKMAYHLLKPFEKDNRLTSREMVEALRLLPLQDGSWVSSRSTVFLPNTGSNPIPNDLGLNLIKSDALGNSARAQLFKRLGARPCEVRLVMKSIEERYRPGTSVNGNFTLAHSLSHLIYLFWNLDESTTKLHDDIWLADDKRIAVRRSGSRRKPIYFINEDEYGPAKLFSAVASPDDTATGLHVSFLNKLYIAQGPPDDARSHGRPWKTWLEDIAGVRSTPELQDQDTTALSSEFKYLISHRSWKLLGTLRAHWETYKPQMTMLKRLLADSEVVCESGRKTKLKDTFLPTPRLKRFVERFGVESFPFVKIDHDLTDGEQSTWQFLTEFDVQIDETLPFLFEILRHVARLPANSLEQSITDSIAELYTRLMLYSGPLRLEDHRNYAGTQLESEAIVYVPPVDTEHVTRPAMWARPRDCLWDAPPWVSTRYRLNNIDRYKVLERLFKDSWKVRDIYWKDVVDELVMRKSSGNHTPRLLESIYGYFSKVFRRDTDSIRQSFEDLKLVYIPGRKTWAAPSACIWAEEAIWIPGKESIATAYLRQHDFFKTMLKIIAPDIQMHVQALTQISQARDPQPAKIKEIILLVSAMQPTQDDLRPLRNANIFPVRIPNGTITRTNSEADFSIADIPEYAAAFEGKAYILDYTPMEVRAAAAFLEALGFEKRYLSLMVNETTTVEGGIFKENLTEGFRWKAYALYRCAVHYNSLKARGGNRLLYDRLLDAKVYVTDGISKALALTQYSKTIFVTHQKGKIHLDESADTLKLYVPRDGNDRAVCFLRQLPRRLLDFLSISNSRAEAVITAIMNASNIFVIDEILKDAGIIEVEGIGRPSASSADSDVEDQQDTSQELAVTSAPLRADLGAGRPRLATAPPSLAPHQGLRTSLPRDIFSAPSAHERRPSSSTFCPAPAPEPYAEPQAETRSQSRPESRNESPPSFTPETTPEGEHDQDDGYGVLLQHVIVAATGHVVEARDGYMAFRGDAEARGSNAFGRVLESLHVRSFDRDRKVGAAGELFVYEFLQTLELPGLSIDNWKSTIRGEVSVHENYSTLESWRGSETADIVYEDLQGELTATLIRFGYFSENVWKDAKPKYYIEVKTTTGSLADKFYMSNPQYERMRAMRITADQPSDKVYVIFRVFDLLAADIGLSLYVDPETCRENRDLHFEVDTWAVKPSR